jgi:glucose/mannose-6-phosphate isomerase
MMDRLISRFMDQLDEALAIGAAAEVRPLEKSIEHVYVAGMGGSGIGADFVANFIREEAKVPYLVGKGYDIPAYVGSRSLGLVSSYSGNTEETLLSFEKMRTAGARIICVASGGKLIDYAEELGLDRIKVPDDWPSPRACLGYSIVSQLHIMHKLGVISDRAIEEIKKSSILLRRETDDIKEKAGKIAQFLHDKLPIVYSTDRFAPVSVRFRQQLNENAKMLSWSGVIPEMNHNELVGWRDINNNLAVVYFRSNDDLERNQTRIDINKEIIGKYTDTIIEVFAKGDSLIEQSMYLVHLGDWISWYISQLRGMDSIEVDVIDYLKGELAKV